MPGVSDLVSQLQAQTEALAQLPLTVAALNSAVQSLIDAVAITRETAASAQRVSERLEEVIEELDEPVRALRPGLERVAKVLDDPVIDTVPETLRKLTEDVVPLVHGLRDAQARVSLVFNQAANASARIADLPGAQLFRRRVRREDGRAEGREDGREDGEAAATVQRRPVTAGTAPVRLPVGGRLPDRTRPAARVRWARMPSPVPVRWAGCRRQYR